jgi:hypothetical protein
LFERIKLYCLSIHHIALIQVKIHTHPLENLPSPWLF